MPVPPLVAMLVAVFMALGFDAALVLARCAIARVRGVTRLHANATPSSHANYSAVAERRCSQALRTITATRPVQWTSDSGGVVFDASSRNFIKSTKSALNDTPARRTRSCSQRGHIQPTRADTTGLETACAARQQRRL